MTRCLNFSFTVVTALEPGTWANIARWMWTSVRDISLAKMGECAPTPLEGTTVSAGALDTPGKIVNRATLMLARLFANIHNI